MKWQPMTKEYSAEQRRSQKKSICMETSDVAELDYKELMQWLE